MDQSLVRVDSVESSEDQEDLRKILKERFEAALKSLVTGVTPRDAVFERPARGGTRVEYVPGWWFIGQLNALFNYNWDFEVVEQFIGQKQVWVKGRLSVRGQGGILVTKMAFGGSDIKTYKDRPSDVIDIGDDLKSASTDALKKAASLIGLASDVYGQRETQEQTGPSRDKLKTLYSIGEKKGMTTEQVDDFCVRKLGKPPEELDTLSVLGLMSLLREANPEG